MSRLVDDILEYGGKMTTNNCLKCMTEIPDDRIYCDKCLDIAK